MKSPLYSMINVCCGALGGFPAIHHGLNIGRNGALRSFEPDFHFLGIPFKNETDLLTHPRGVAPVPAGEARGGVRRHKFPAKYRAEGGHPPPARRAGWAVARS